MGLIIGLTGPDGVGKTVVAKALAIRRLSFATPLKRMMEALLGTMGYDEDEAYAFLYGSRKNEPIPLAGGKTARELMRTLGTEWGRDLVSPNLWVDIMMNKTGNSSVVFDDVRFLSEAMAIKKAGGHLFELWRDGIEYTHDHRSNEGLPGFTKIHNTSPQDAAEAIKKVVQGAG